MYYVVWSGIRDFWEFKRRHYQIRNMGNDIPIEDGECRRKLRHEPLSTAIITLLEKFSTADLCQLYLNQNPSSTTETNTAQQHEHTPEAAPVYSGNPS